VVNVSWNEAKAFCAWLTKKEQAEGKINASQSYRLPTDAEWSLAVGLEGESGSSPEDKSTKIQGVYPWGTSWPPPSGTGNFDVTKKLDTFDKTSPVGSFKANAYGLYDMSGNVCQLCEDTYNSQDSYRVKRGSSWGLSTSDNCLSSYRNGCKPDSRDDINGFRCVLETGGSPQ
jgi:formylglycine-generating enzyme required for sulfatase activity